MSLSSSNSSLVLKLINYQSDNHYYSVTIIKFVIFQIMIIAK